MGHRLSAIATRTGDGGETGLGDGSRISKAAPRVAAMGDVDELNSALGLLLAMGLPQLGELAQRTLLTQVQQDLFDIGGELCIPGYRLLKEERLAALDAWLAQANSTLPRLEEFILPGGTLHAAQAHVCRTLCRRAERAVVALGTQTHTGTDTHDDSPNANALRYLNRLSDLLFVMARQLNLQAGQAEPQWQHERPGQPAP
jgi:cob(I)alamin adenosyltransferase